MNYVESLDYLDSLGRLCPSCTKRWMDSAPSRPAAIASMANLGPVSASPPTKMSGCVPEEKIRKYGFAFRGKEVLIG